MLIVFSPSMKAHNKKLSPIAYQASKELTRVMREYFNNQMSVPTKPGDEQEVAR